MIGVDSLSKTLSPGLRIGWVVANGPVLDRIATEKRNDDGHSPTLTQQIVARYLAEGHYESHLETARDLHRVRRDAPNLNVLETGQYWRVMAELVA